MWRPLCLAALNTAPERASAFGKEFSSILTYIGQLDELTLPNQGAPEAPLHHNAFRDDGEAYIPGTWTETLVRAFPFKRGSTLQVKKIITHD